MATPGNAGALRYVPVRWRFGPTPNAQTQVCAHCRKAFERGGLWLRLEQWVITVEIRLCQNFPSVGNLFEAVVPFDLPHP